MGALAVLTGFNCGGSQKAVLLTEQTAAEGDKTSHGKKDDEFPRKTQEPLSQWKCGKRGSVY
jgi:hypothetical protein